MSTPLPDLPVGDLQLYDRYVPHLYGGNYEITVAHELAGVDTGPLRATQKFTVSAPQFTVAPGEVLQVFPPDGGAGQFADTLPFVVLAEPLLPWERKMPGAGDPWLAVLVFGGDELGAPPAGAEASPTGAIATTVQRFLALGDALVPPITREADVPDTQPCSYVRVPAAVFRAVAPRLAEAPYLAHVRQVNTGDRAVQGPGGEGLFSVVVANRFPAADPAAKEAVRNVAHLVSLEGLAPYLVDQPVFTRSGTGDGTREFDAVALLSLASWSFQVLPDPAGSFQGLMLDLLDAEYDPAAQRHSPHNLGLRLPVPALSVDDPVGAEMVKRVVDGFLPLAYHTRSGEDTFAWYRGPLSPVLTTALPGKTGPFLTADAAIVYDAAHGVFDLSLAGAWTMGRAAALADRAFGQTLMELRRRLHRLTDTLHDRLRRDHFDTPEDLKQLAASGLLPRKLLATLDADLLQRIGRAPAPTRPQAPPEGGAPPDTDPRTALRNFLAEPATRAAVLELVEDELKPVARWLARLALLHPLPFEMLVPDPRMLPLVSPPADVRVHDPLQGSVRFFYVDANWVAAAMDGALSIGLESSRHAFYAQMTAGVLHQAAAEAAAALRGPLPGVEPAPGAGREIVTGMLLRSAVVSGWPNLAVRPLDAAGKLVKTLRMDHLAPGVLLCLFDGVPARIMIAEPQEGLRFGTDEQGAVELRNLQPPRAGGDAPVGRALGQTFAVRDPAGKQPLFTRGGGRVLDLSPGSPGGLVRSLAAKLAALGQPVTPADFGPAAFALQMVRAPEELTFESRGPS